MIEDIEDYFARGCGRCARFETPDCATRLWARGLADLRTVCRAAGLEEAVRWGHPCYRHAGRNVVLIGATRGGYSLSFFDAAHIPDLEALMEPAGPNSPRPSVIRFADPARARTLAPVLSRYLDAARRVAEAGLRAATTPPPLDLPTELADALATDPVLAAAFDALTPGRRRSHAIAVASARTTATRVARIGRLRDRILAGKGATER